MFVFGLLAQLVPNHEHEHGHEKDIKEKKKQSVNGKVDPVRLFS